MGADKLHVQQKQPCSEVKDKHGAGGGGVVLCRRAWEADKSLAAWPLGDLPDWVGKPSGQAGNSG